MNQLNRLGSGTVQEICAHLGVTATAVRQRLTRLQGLDLVAREVCRAGGRSAIESDADTGSNDAQKLQKSGTGRGRPSHVYRVTDAGKKELGENFAELAGILWSELKKISDPGVRATVLGSVTQSLVERYGSDVRGDSLSDRLKELCQALASRGFDVELSQRDSLPVLRENNCPYLELASSDPSICEMEQEVFGLILGVSVKLTQCCLNGGRCCEFEPSEPALFGLVAPDPVPALLALPG